MAVLSQDKVVRQWSSGDAEKTAVYALKRVTTGDTIDLVADFSELKRAVAVGTTVAGQAVVTVAGTVATMPAGLANDAGFMMVYGVSS